MIKSAAIQDILQAICNAVLELHDPAQESDEPRRPMIVDEKENVGVPCGIVRNMRATENDGNQVVFFVPPTVTPTPTPTATPMIMTMSTAKH